MEGKPKYYITTAIAYASARPHFGNTYEIIFADAIARYKRQRGYEVFFLTGTDEHGQKIEHKAQEAGLSPKEYVDRIAIGEIKRIWDLLGASYDKFIRTTDDYHERAVAAIFKKFYEQGDIYKDKYEGWYCEPDESFYTESQVVEKDGVKVCPDCGRPVIRTHEEAYFFRMSAYADKLLKYIEEHPEFIEPESRRKEMINNFLLPGLQDLCVSRSSFKWGIPVPFDEGHVIYVWLDALSNYITALGYNPDGCEGDLFEKYWPADVHIIGKDIMRFHTIYWPIFLMALGLPLPKKVFGHPWFLFGSDKMSKSRGNIIYADDLVEKLGVDAVRHISLAEMPYNADGNVTWESILSRYNTDLANNLGNLVSRTHAMTKRFFEGIVPAPAGDEGPDADLKALAGDTVKEFDRLMDTFHTADAVDVLFALFKRANKYIDETMPWALAKDETKKERLGTVLYNLLETIRLGAVLLEPLMPGTSAEILRQLGTDVQSFEFGGLVPGTKLGEAKILFERIDEEKMLAELAKETAKAHEEKAAEKAAVPEPEHEPEISIEQFMGTELRVALVTACEPVPKAKKLLKLTLDLGYETRTVVSGIAEFYKPEDLVGKKVVCVANLKPAVIRGVESRGMILASSSADGKISVLLADGNPGDRVR
ncbi:MAG TPA: methionine--tRNA ligase [Clostridiales bacterium]|nr:methionine--tRNA ligase [Clostridiales bacterium]